MGLGVTEDEMVGWHHQLDEQEFEQTLGDSEGQGSLACCSPCGHRVGTTERLNNNNTCSMTEFVMYKRIKPVLE